MTAHDEWAYSWTNPDSFKPKLEHTVLASSLEQAHRLACEAGAAFFGVPIEAIRAEPQSARADLLCVDGTVLTYQVDFITTPLARNGEQP